MSDPLKDLLSANAVPITAFPPTSRYADTDVTTHEGLDESLPVPHLARRFCPQPTRFAVLYEARIIETDRRDTLSAKHFGDPELWWRLADANGVIDPRSLSEPAGSRIRITLAIDIPGSLDD